MHVMGSMSFAFVLKIKAIGQVLQACFSSHII